MTLKITLTMKIERIKDTSNAKNFQWDYQGLTFLDLADKFQSDQREHFSVIIFCEAFQWFFTVVELISMIFSVIFS